MIVIGTVGYGDASPHSFDGKIFAAVRFQKISGRGQLTIAMKRGVKIDKVKSFMQDAFFIAGFYFSFLFAENYTSVFNKKKITRPSQTENILGFLKISLMIFGFSMAGLIFYSMTKGNAIYQMNRMINVSLIMASSYLIYKMLVYTYQEFFRYRKM